MITDMWIVPYIPFLFNSPSQYPIFICNYDILLILIIYKHSFILNCSSSSLLIANLSQIMFFLPIKCVLSFKCFLSSPYPNLPPFSRPEWLWHPTLLFPSSYLSTFCTHCHTSLSETIPYSLVMVLYNLPQWFSNSNTHSHHLEVWLEHRSLSPIPEFLIQKVWDRLENLQLWSRTTLWGPLIYYINFKPLSGFQSSPFLTFVPRIPCNHLNT